MRRFWWLLGGWLLGLWACDDGAPTPGPDVSVDSAIIDARVIDSGFDAGLVLDMHPADATPGDAQVPDAAFGPGDEVTLTVNLDGVPTADILVMQGGTERYLRTDANGRVTVPIDTAIEGVAVIVASHPDARIKAFTLWPDEPVRDSLELTRLGPDNPRYTFLDPGTPERRNSTAECGHCHLTMNDDWFDSPHRTSASNPVVQAVYRGTSRTGRPVAPPVAEQLPGFGECADCHAPGMDGRLGGRDLARADGFALEYGVHCDVCHSVESVDLDSNAPGVAGRLRIQRPSILGPITLGANGVLPLTFGPSHDSPNPRMGSVQRDHYRNAQICAGCHQYTAAQAVDMTRWPDGRLPVHTTYSEWKTGVLGEAALCNDCHMPPLPKVANGADKQAFPAADLGITGGFIRPAGAARSHSWVGPRTPESGMLALAGALFIDTQIIDGDVVAQVTLRNQGAGHALPTGEPLRAIFVQVEAFCGEAPLAPSGGDVLPDWTGALEARAADADWSRWPNAVAGQTLRVVRRPGGFHDYPGVEPFADRFDAVQKGLPIEVLAGVATIMNVAPNGDVELSAPLPAAQPGDHVYRVDAPLTAGAPGFAYARVMVDADGRPMVPHYLAVDVRSDNRLPPMAAWTSTHRFTTACPDPTVRAQAIYRRYPAALAAERGWPLEDEVMTTVTR